MNVSHSRASGGHFRLAATSPRPISLEKSRISSSKLRRIDETPRTIFSPKIIPWAKTISLRPDVGSRKSIYQLSAAPRARGHRPTCTFFPGTNSAMVCQLSDGARARDEGGKQMANVTTVKAHHSLRPSLREVLLGGKSGHELQHNQRSCSKLLNVVLDLGKLPARTNWTFWVDTTGTNEQNQQQASRDAFRVDW